MIDGKFVITTDQKIGTRNNRIILLEKDLIKAKKKNSLKKIAQLERSIKIAKKEIISKMGL